MKKILFFFILLLSFSLFSREVRVTSTADSGVGTLRESITNALAFDTIYVDVKGEIILNSSIEFPVSNVTVIGPYPKHNNITAGTTNLNFFTIDGKNDIKIEGLGFRNSSDARVCSVSNATNFILESCLIENNTFSIAGVLFFDNSTYSILNCSFIGNTASNGGAINTSSTLGISKIVNCTFHNNTSMDHGGALYFEDLCTVELVNNLFTDNNASSGLGEAIQSYGAANTINFYNNVFSNNGTAGEVQITTSLGSFFNFAGGNVYYENDIGSDAPITYTGSNQLNPANPIGLRATMVEDGYGLKYFPIVDVSSSLVDGGQDLGNIPSTDTRRAPRVLSGDVGFIIDAGPCEYTLFRVTSMSGAGGLEAAVSSLNSTGSDPVNYIEFDIVSYNPAQEFDISSTLDITKTTFIDGYSQNGTAIAGPGTNAAADVTPAENLINVTSSATVPDGFLLGATDIKISGFNVFGFDQNGIKLWNGANGIQVFGNHIGFKGNSGVYVVDENKFTGIQVSVNDAYIGGNRHFERNVIGGNGQTGGAGYLSNLHFNTNVIGASAVGNFIGVKPDGLLPFTSLSGTADGVYLQGDNTNCENILIGNTLVGGRNIISGNAGSGIYMYQVGSGNIVDNNIIGLGYDGSTAIPNGVHGIKLTSNSNEIKIGSVSGNVISGNSNNSGISLLNTNLTVIKQNLIGTDSSGTVSRGNFYGITISGSSSNNKIGVDTLNGNVISGNSSHGVQLINGSGNMVQGNRIGTNKLGTVAIANSHNAVYSQDATGTLIGGSQLTRNILSGNGLQGVALVNAGSTTVTANFIGLDYLGLSAIPNQNGIYITGTHTAVFGAAFPNHNVISGNNDNGINVNSENVQVEGNLIGLNKNQNAIIANGSDGVLVNANNVIIGGANINIIAGNIGSGITLNNVIGCDIDRCLIGTNSLSTPGLGNGLYGIYMASGNDHDVGINAGNTIVGHTAGGYAGIRLDGTSGTWLQNNLIGITSSNVIIPNQKGIQLINGASTNVIGEVLATNRNVISGNIEAGVDIEGATTTNNTVQGNVIGLGITAGSATPKANNYGITIHDGANDNKIGAEGDESKRNVISANTTAGIYISGTGTTNNKIFHNNLGTTTDYALSVANNRAIWVENCNTINYIGIDSPLSSPIISGNNNGILIDNSSNQVIYNCKIGTTPDGISAQANVNGIVIQNSSSNNIIGGVGLKSNLVSGNDAVGIAINNSSDNKVIGNLIGSNINIDGAITNLVGVIVNGGDGNHIGTPTVGEGNLISGNSGVGVSLENNPSNTLIQNNKIGTDLTGNNVYLGSANGVGVQIKNTTANTNQIGGNYTLNEGNVFADNGVSVYIENSSSQGVYGNVIGIKVDGSAYLGNNNSNIGVYLKGGNNNRVGEPDNNRNYIANQVLNVYVDNETNTDVLGNYIGTNLTGNGILGGLVVSTSVGVKVDSGSLNTRILENVMSGLYNGIEIKGLGTNNNTIQGNKIGTDLTGNNLLGNTNNGILMYGGSDINVIGGDINDLTQRNVISGNTYAGIEIIESGDVTIAGNYIGSAQNGTAAIPNRFGIIASNHANTNVVSGTRIGGNDLDSINYVVGSTENGIAIGENFSDVYILGNVIGELPSAVASGNAYAGIVAMQNAQNVYVGGIGLYEGNKITNSGQAGVTVNNLASNVIILGNSIFNNQLGIDIAADGVTPDNVTGIQGNVQMPILLAGFECNSSGSVDVGVVLRNLIAGQDYIIEFYDNSSAPNGSGFGEADFFISRFNYTAVGTQDTVSFNIGGLASSSQISASLTALNGNGGTSEMAQNYTITNQPSDPTITTTNETCQGAADASIQIDDVVNSQVYYFGLNSDVPQFSTSFDTLISVEPGVHSVTYKYLNGCEVTNSGQTILGGPTPTFTDVAVKDTCGIGGQIIMDASGNTTGTFTAASYQNITSAISQGTNTFTGLAAGNYDVVLHTDLAGTTCVSDTITVTILEEDLEANGFLDFTFDDFCATAGLGQVTTQPSYTNGLYTLSVNPTGATINAGTGEISGTVSQGVQYTVDYTYGTCLFQQSPTAIDVIDPTFTFDSYCLATQSVNSAVNPGGTYSFNPAVSDGATIDPTSGAITSPVGGTTYTVEYNTGGGCPGVTTVDVTVYDLPATPIILASDSVICAGEALPSIFIDGTGLVDWYTDESLPAVETGTNSYTPTSLNLGETYFYGRVTSADGCLSGFGSVKVLKPTLSDLTAGDDVEICLGAEVEIFAYNGAAYIWNVGDDIENNTSESITVSPNSETFYSVVIFDENDCKTVDSVKVSILDPSECNITTYTAFSPNGDGDNDVWLIDGIEGYKENIVYFYNRWGDLVFDIENYDNLENVWDGTNKLTGTDVAPGTYFYIVESSGINAKSGWVQVVK